MKFFANDRKRAVEELRADLSHVLTGMLHQKELEASAASTRKQIESEGKDGKDAIEKAPMICPDCNAALTSINYELWGKKKFNPMTGNYEDDRAWGSSEMQLSCPACSATLDPDPAIDY